MVDDDDPGWFATQLTDEQAEALRESMAKVIAEASPNFGTALRRLEGAVAAVQPFDLICIAVFYFLTVEEGVNPEYNRPEEIFQHHVELIQALSLRRPIEKTTPSVSVQDGMAEVLDAVKETVNAFMMLEMAGIAAQRDDSQRRAFTIAEMRTRAATIRGWSYYTDLSQVLVELYSPIEPQIEATLGVSASGLVSWWWAVTERVEKRMANHRQRVRDLLDAPLDDAWPALVEQTFPRLPTDLDEALLDRLRADEDQRRAFVVIAADLNLYQVFGMTGDELRDCYPGDVDRAALEKVLDAWSLSFGATVQPLHELIQDNPVLSRPLVKLDDGLYLWTIASAFNHSAFVMLERLLEDDQALWVAYLGLRARYLEERVSRALRQAFPNGRVLTNVVWCDPADGKNYETDVLLLVGSHALVAECKSGRLSRRAQKGRGRWFRDDVRDLIIEPARQAQRFADFLVGQSGSLQLETRTGESEVIDASDIRAAITIGVTLEALVGLLPGIGEIMESEFTDTAIESLTHSLTLFDLLVVLEMLDHPSEMLHYFLRRSQLERNQFLVGEETDLLGFYLLTGFNLGSAEFEDELQRMRLIGLSDAVDTYHYILEAGKDAEKPRMRRTEWWESLLTAIERRAGPRWTELGMALCNVAYDEQLEFEQAFEELRSTIRDARRPASDFVVFANGPPERRDYFIGLVLNQDSRDERRQQIVDVAKQAMAGEKAMDRVIIIGWSPVRQVTPYQILALFERRDERAGTGSLA